MQRSIELERFASLLVILDKINELLIVIDEEKATREDVNNLLCYFISIENFASESYALQEARSFAIKRMMDSFEKSLLLPMEDDPDTIEHMNKNQLQGNETSEKQIVIWDNIEKLLQRRLLGQWFAQAYLRAEKIIQRFIDATSKTPYRQTWQSRQHRIKENLLLEKI